VEFRDDETLLKPHETLTFSFRHVSLSNAMNL
jgi:hypothetical protein